MPPDSGQPSKSSRLRALAASHRASPTAPTRQARRTRPPGGWPTPPTRPPAWPACPATCWMTRFAAATWPASRSADADSSPAATCSSFPATPPRTLHQRACRPQIAAQDTASGRRKTTAAGPVPGRPSHRARPRRGRRTRQPRQPRHRPAATTAIRMGPGLLHPHRRDHSGTQDRTAPPCPLRQLPPAPSRPAHAIQHRPRRHPRAGRPGRRRRLQPDRPSRPDAHRPPQPPQARPHPPRQTWPDTDRSRIITLARRDPRSQLVSLILDAATADIAMFAAAAHADEREAHVCDAERYGQNLPDGSYGRRNRPPAASHRTRPPDNRRTRCRRAAWARQRLLSRSARGRLGDRAGVSPTSQP